MQNYMDLYRREWRSKEENMYIENRKYKKRKTEQKLK
jgi:hypothetical protein